MGHVDQTKGLDGKGYTVSTAQKFDTWETGVFQAGGLGVMLGRGLCFVEEVLGDQPGEALIAHQRALGMVTLVPRSQWEMSADTIKAARQPAVDYVTARSEMEKHTVRFYQSAQAESGADTSRSEAVLRAAGAYGPGTVPLLDWLKRLMSLGDGWNQICDSASADNRWADPATFAVAAKVVEANMGMKAGVMLASGSIGIAVARARMSEERSRLAMAAGRNAAVAVLTGHAIAGAVADSLYRPFAAILPRASVQH